MRLARHLWLLAAFAITPAHAAECPADKPIKKTVASLAMTCTAVACLGRLVCPSREVLVLPGGLVSSAECSYMPAENCNTCKQDVSEICLSQDDFDKASAR